MIVRFEQKGIRNDFRPETILSKCLIVISKLF